MLINIDATDSARGTALTFAAGRNANEEMVAFMLENGAKFDH